MLLLYSIGIRLYHFAAALASPFNAKAKAFTEGRRNLFQKVARTTKRICKTHLVSLFFLW